MKQLIHFCLQTALKLSPLLLLLLMNHVAALEPWPSEPPADCPFSPSEEIVGIVFTGIYSDYHVADTWYPSWAEDGNLYSPWTDGALFEESSNSDGYTFVQEGVLGLHNAERRPATTGQAKMIGDDPLHLTLISLGTVQADPYPYGGRYPCGSLLVNGVWYYGTYCLAPHGVTRFGSTLTNWPWLGPLVGFRTSIDYGKTWKETPHTPEKPLFGESGLWGHPVKIGSPHFVDFGKNMEHSPDGFAYLVGHGAEYPDPQPRFANLSWISGDQIYLIRVKPTIETINDASSYQFFAGYDDHGHAQWSKDFADIVPLIDWNNNCGCVTMTYFAPLNKYIMCITDGWPTCARMNSYLLEADDITGPFRLVAYMKNFGEQGYFLNFPSKFISRNGETAWLCYSGNFAKDWNGQQIQEIPPGSHYGLVLQQVKFLLKARVKP